jgi:hypothetical protein
VLSIEQFMGAPPANENVGLLLDSKIPHNEIRAGHDAWLVLRRDSEANRT